MEASEPTEMIGSEPVPLENSTRCLQLIVRTATDPAARMRTASVPAYRGMSPQNSGDHPNVASRGSFGPLILGNVHVSDQSSLMRDGGVAHRRASFVHPCTSEGRKHPRHPAFGNGDADGLRFIDELASSSTSPASSSSRSSSEFEERNKKPVGRPIQDSLRQPKQREGPQPKQSRVLTRIYRFAASPAPGSVRS